MSVRHRELPAGQLPKDLAVGFNLSKLGIEPRHLAYLVEDESKTNNLTKCHIIS